MKRRQVIRRTGIPVATGLAGCQTSGDPTRTPTDSSTPIRSPTLTRTQTPTETPTDTPTKTPTDTSEPTSSDKEIAADHIEAARSHLTDAVDAYTREAGPNSGWVDVGATLTVADDDV